MSLVAGLLNHKYRLKIYSVSRDRHSTITRTLVYSNVRCRWEEKTTIITTKDGQEKTATINAWISPEYTVEEDYEIVQNNKTYKIVSVNPRYDLTGKKDHIRLFLA